MEAYVRRVTRAADRLVRQGFLLEEDKERIIKEAAEKGTDLWKTDP